MARLWVVVFIVAPCERWCIGCVMSVSEFESSVLGHFTTRLIRITLGWAYQRSIVSPLARCDFIRFVPWSFLVDSSCFTLVWWFFSCIVHVRPSLRCLVELVWSGVVCMNFALRIHLSSLPIRKRVTVNLCVSMCSFASLYTRSRRPVFAP